MAKPLSFGACLTALEAGGEDTRLRILSLLFEAELTVSELVVILGQSQPRISRHLKLLVDAGVIERHREGAWAFFAGAQRTAVADLSRDVVRRLDPADPILLADRARLTEVRAARQAQADRYFAAHAVNWDQLRALHVAEERVEQAVLDTAGEGPFQALLDLGTGTGRMLELLAPRAVRALGIDGSPPMLNVARARLDRKLRNVQLRQGDLYALPVERQAYDLIVVHQVLHYLDEPARAIREAARVLRPGGRLLIVDFAPHRQDELRDQHAHRRLGFSRAEVDDFMAEAGLVVDGGRDVSPLGHEAGKLTVSIWVGRDARVQSDLLSHHSERAVA